MSLSITAMRRFYRHAGAALRQIDSRRCSVAAVALRPGALFKKRLVALLSETIKKRSALEALLRRISKDSMSGHEETEWLVVLHDFIYYTEAKYRSRLLRLYPTLQENEKLLLEAWDQLRPADDSAQPSCNSRYIRLNILRAPEQEILDQLGSSFDVGGGDSWYERDPHVPHLIRVTRPGRLECHQLSSVQEGLVFIQDKASCMPALALDPPQDSTVLDACAAPGNKTTHLAMIMHDKGKIFAFERDPDRYTTLNRMVELSSSSIVSTFLRDFLSVNPHEPPFSSVEYILLDPSCSGKHEASEARIRALASFQKRALLHSMSFPNVRRIVYSTCTESEQQNEHVVHNALTHRSDFVLVPALPFWPRRGLAGILPAGQEQLLLRADPRLDDSHPFFIAVFEKKQLNISL